MEKTTRAALLVLAASFYTVIRTDAHSFLIEPTADWTNNKQPECRVGKPDGPQFAHFDAMNCPGPCGDTGKRRNGAEFFSTSKGHTKLSRGQKLYMKWTKNNHNNGFVRFTLVPVSQRMNKGVHDKFAFHYSCWEAGEIGCEHGDECGTDENRLRYQTEVEIPRIFPDGEYILGWSWYGGTMYRDGSEKAEFGDYWSCSNIQIRGSIDRNGAWQDDKSHEAEYTPVFIPGMNDKSMKKCKSSVNRLGVCATEPCYGRYEGSFQVPAGFENGRTPAPVRASDVLEITGSESTLVNNHASNNHVDESSNAIVDNNSKMSIKRLELVDTSDMSVITSDFSKPLDVNRIRKHMTIRAIVEPIDGVRIVQFSAGDHKHTEGLSPYYIAGDSERGTNAWAGKFGPPMNTDFTLRVTVTGKDGAVVEKKVYPHFLSES